MANVGTAGEEQFLVTYDSTVGATTAVDTTDPLLAFDPTWAEHCEHLVSRPLF